MSSINWFDMVTKEEEERDTRLLRLSPEEWRKEGQAIIRTWRGDLRQCINYLDEMDAKRAAYAQAAAAPAPEPRIRSEFEVDFGLWKDMIEEPAKYGTDISEWLELNERLTHSPGRWRLGAYWDQVQVQMEEANAQRSETEAATRIQAAVRGHLARSKQTFRDCCMCLSHRISPLITDVGRMCRGCAEQGPYTEETGPIADPWSEFRGDYMDPTPRPVAVHLCDYCETRISTDRQFCDRDCEYAYMKEAWGMGY